MQFDSDEEMRGSLGGSSGSSIENWHPIVEYPGRIELKLFHGNSAVERVLVPEIMRLFVECFPGQADEYFKGPSSEEASSPCIDSSTCSELLDSIIGFHNPHLVLWLLLFLDDALIGMACSIKYVKSLFLFNLCIRPSLRSKGFGHLLLIETAHLATMMNQFILSGNVDFENSSTVDYYSKKGAQVHVEEVLNTSKERFTFQRLTKEFSPQDLFKQAALMSHYLSSHFQ